MKTRPTDLTADPKILSPRERATVERLALGYTNREIAADLGISSKTIDTHRGHALSKLGLRNNADLTRWAVAHGIVDVPSLFVVDGVVVENFEVAS